MTTDNTSRAPRPVSRKRFLQSLGLVAAGTALPSAAVAAAGATPFPFALRGVGDWQGEHLRARYAEVARAARELGISRAHAEATFAPVQVRHRDAERLVAEVASGQLMYVERVGGRERIRFADAA